jgi:hypothetical protein
MLGIAVYILPVEPWTDRVHVSPLEADWLELASSRLLRDAACADEIQRRVYLAQPACSALISWADMVLAPSVAGLSIA